MLDTVPNNGENMAISQELEVSLHMAFVEARQKCYEFITVEHLLLCLLDNPSAAEVLKECKADTEVLRCDLTTFIDAYQPTNEDIRIRDAHRVNLREVSASPSEGGEVNAQPTLGFQRVIQRAIMYCQKRNIDTDGASVLLATFGEEDSHAVHSACTSGASHGRSQLISCLGAQLPMPATSSGADRQEVRKVLGVATVYQIEIKVIAPPGASTESTQHIVSLLMDMLKLPVGDEQNMRISITGL